jgi:hypothetical protein
VAFEEISTCEYLPLSVGMVVTLWKDVVVRKSLKIPNDLKFQKGDNNGKSGI